MVTQLRATEIKFFWSGTTVIRSLKLLNFISKKEVIPPTVQIRKGGFRAVRLINPSRQESHLSL